MLKMTKIRLWAVSLPLGVLSFLAIVIPGSAYASSANISSSYSASSDVINGSIVSLDPTKPGFIQLANTDNDSRLAGVVLDSSDSLLAIDSSSTTVQVAISGNVNTLVSTLNGDIHIGDTISASPFSGIGMVAPAGAHVIGVAQSELNNKSSGLTTQKVKNKKGQYESIHTGYIHLTIAIGTSATAPLNGLQRFTKSLTGQTVSTIRIIFSLVVFVIGVLAIITLIYASIYSSITSIGRNPLAKFAIFRTLGYVLGMVILISSVSGLTIFLLLN